MKWDVDEGHSFLWVTPEAAKALLGSMKGKVGTNFTKNMCYVKNFQFKWCTLESENERVGNFLVKRFENKKFAAKFIRDYNSFYKVAVRELNCLDKTDFSKIINEELFGILKRTTQLYVENFDFGFIAEPMDFVLPKMIEPRLIKHGYSPQEISDVLVPAFTSFFNKEKKDLIRIAKAPENKQEMLLKKHAYDYRWIQTVHMGRKNVPLSYFRKELEELKDKGLGNELKFLKNFKRNSLARKKELFNKKPIDAETKKLLEVADIIGLPHDMRKELFMRTVYTLDTARGEIAKRYGYTKDELSVFDSDDILKLNQGKKLDKKFAHQLLEEGLVYVEQEKGKLSKKYFTGGKARALMEKELALNVTGIKEIKGMCASIGRVKGYVQIIHGAQDIHKMKEGSILVTSMTRPEHIPAIKKAAAIVTDEGGVTCHAAIVSREFNVPCIIGTRIALKILRDGDLVEVDASHGIVKILKRGKNA